MQLTAVYIEVSEGYIAFVEELPGASTQGATLEEARDRLHDAVEAILEAQRAKSERSLVGLCAIKETFELEPAES
jgi:predicted RNase H-like HicB family nuclease